MINTYDKENIYKFLIKCNNYIEKCSYFKYFNPNIIALIRKALSRLRVLTYRDTQINNVITLIHQKFETEGYKVKNIFGNLPDEYKNEIILYSSLFSSEVEIKDGENMDIWHDMEKLCQEIPLIDGKEEVYFN